MLPANAFLLPWSLTVFECYIALAVAVLVFLCLTKDSPKVLVYVPWVLAIFGVCWSFSVIYLNAANNRVINCVNLPPYYVSSPTLCNDDVPRNLCRDPMNKVFVRAHTPFPFDVQELHFESSVPLPIHSLMNPSIAPAPDGNGIIFAIRESTFHYCNGNPIDSRMYLSHVLFGTAPTARGPIRFSSNFTHLFPENQPPIVFHGPEDPRFMYFPNPKSPTGKSLFLMTVLNGTLHMSRIHFNRTTEGVSIKEGNRVQLWLEGTPKHKTQKNWMHIPDTMAPDGKPLLCYKLNPLEVVSVDLKSGAATYVSQQPQIKDTPEIRGNTNFLHHPTKPNVFIGIGHEIVPPGIYYSHIVSIEEYAPAKFRLVGISDPFGLPINNTHPCVNRIHFPSSILYGDNKESIIIGMGYMDCTAHTVVVKTSDFLATIKPISLSTQPLDKD